MLSADSSPRARVVLLGASNLTRGISTVVETARLALGSPLEFLIAHGHGRAFGMASRLFFVRTLPSILDCGLWDALEQSCRQRPDLPTFALITDVGNDIVYGASPQRLVEAVERCIERLQSLPCRPCIVMTMVPIQSIRAVRRWKFAVVKRVLFPTRKLSYEDALRRAEDLHEELLDLARRRQVPLIESPGEWYGFDPIHIQVRSWASAWRTILEQCFQRECSAPDQQRAMPLARPSLTRMVRLRAMLHEHWTVLGHDWGRPQPVGRLRDGSTIALY